MLTRRTFGARLAHTGTAMLLPCSVGSIALIRSARGDEVLIDDFRRDDLVTHIGNPWRGVTDQVMGGVSAVELSYAIRDGRPCAQMSGSVSLDNNGGFVQMATNLAVDGNTLNAAALIGVSLTVIGNGEQYSVHLRTPDNQRPWQSYRAHFVAQEHWHEVRLPFASFTPHRIDVPLDSSRLKRIGVVAIGRAFSADLAVSRVAFY